MDSDYCAIISTMENVAIKKCVSFNKMKTFQKLQMMLEKNVQNENRLQKNSKDLGKHHLYHQDQKYDKMDEEQSLGILRKK